MVPDFRNVQSNLKPVDPFVPNSSSNTKKHHNCELCFLNENSNIINPNAHEFVLYLYASVVNDGESSA